MEIYLFRGLVAAVLDAIAPSWTEVASAIAAMVGGAAAVATLVIAVVAVLYAKRQVKGARDQLDEARTLRFEQSQPYVVVYAMPNRVSPQMIEVVIQNLGATGARDVSIVSSPHLVRTDQQGGSEEVGLPDTMPFVAPGQEWRTVWDTSIERNDAGLPDRYEVTVTYTDSLGNTHTTPSVLDWRFFRQRMWVSEKTIHDAAKSLEAIDKSLKRLTEDGRVQRVATYDGIERDARSAEAQRERQMRHEKLVAKLRPDRPLPGRTEDDQG